MGIRNPVEVFGFAVLGSKPWGAAQSCQSLPAQRVLSGYHALAGMQEVQTHPHHLPGQDGVCGRVLAQERGGDVLTVLQGLGWQPVVSQAGGIEQLVHLGRGKQSSRGWEQGDRKVCGCSVLWHITPA